MTRNTLESLAINRVDKLVVDEEAKREATFALEPTWKQRQMERIRVSATTFKALPR